MRPLAALAALLLSLPACFLFEPIGPPPSRPEPLGEQPPRPTPAASAWSARSDSDGDGVLDMHDRCPNDPEDRDLFEDEDGCPDPDNDRDGILDRCDRCPNDPETYNGFDDADGCPDSQRVIVKPARIVIVQFVHFALGQHRFGAPSLPVVDATAEVLKEHPEIEVVAVIGHTSQDEQRPDLLSLRRAQEVRAALIQRGIDADRVVAFGAGSRQPIADNKTTEGREKNRRTEFRILSLQGSEIARWDGAQVVAVDPPPSPPRPPPPPVPVIPGCP